MLLFSPQMFSEQQLFHQMGHDPVPNRGVFDGQLKESEVRPREIPSPKDSVFLANMRSHQKVFHRLAEFGKMPQEPGANFLEGVENDLRSTENSQNESHLQDHLDERMTPHPSVQDNTPMCHKCRKAS